jgi:hypothetical protein
MQVPAETTGKAIVVTKAPTPIIGSKNLNKALPAIENPTVALKPKEAMIYVYRTMFKLMGIFCSLRKLFTSSINLCQIYYFALIRFII